jgi:hypothetical protein
MIDKGGIRKITLQIRDVLMRDWDPIGVPDLPAGEYDSYIGGIYRLIVRGASLDEIEQHLRTMEVERIEIVVGDSQRARVAKSLRELASHLSTNQ